MARLRRPSPRAIAVACLALLVAGAPFLPDGDRSDDALAPASLPPNALHHATAGTGRVTPAMQQEIDRVVGKGDQLRARAARADVATQVRQAVRCAEFEGQRYCLHSGWTTRTEEELASELTAGAPAMVRQRSSTEQTGDLDPVEAVRQHLALPPRRQAALERRDLTEAARSVAKVWLLRHQVQGVPLPPGFLERHPEVRLDDQPAAEALAATREDNGDAISLTSSASGKTWSDYPRRATIMRTRWTAEQVRSYWCGPASMQMIEWGWTGTRQSQGFWARRLGTTTSGTAISSMVRVTNRYTGYDRPARAGTYVVLDIGSWSWPQWWLLQMRHINDYRAPVILHPVLRKRYFPYLDDDASGHFQVGRGYDKAGRDPNLLGYFEPWNQQRFNPSEPYIRRVQWRQAYRSFRANKAHPQHNIGV